VLISPSVLSCVWHGQASLVAEGALLLLPPLALRRGPDAPPAGPPVALFLTAPHPGGLRRTLQQGRRGACDATTTGYIRKGDARSP
jgi:hypothetical protein